jgi:hypothetical protein
VSYYSRQHHIRVSCNLQFSIIRSIASECCSELFKAMKMWSKVGRRTIMFCQVVILLVVSFCSQEGTHGVSLQEDLTLTSNQKQILDRVIIVLNLSSVKEQNHLIQWFDFLLNSFSSERQSSLSFLVIIWNRTFILSGGYGVCAIKSHLPYIHLSICKAVSF